MKPINIILYLEVKNDQLTYYAIIKEFFLPLLTEPGTFQFAESSILGKKSCGKAEIPVERINGCDGRVVIKWRTEDITAHSGTDYEGGEGTLIFEHGEMTKVTLDFSTAVHKLINPNEIIN